MRDGLPSTMTGVRLMGYGGFDKLELRHDLPIPNLLTGEVLIKIGAAGVNNTDINTRIGWYSKTVASDTDSGSVNGFSVATDDKASWSGGVFHFPRIQGADIAGEIIAVGEGVSAGRVGERVLVRAIRASTRNDKDFNLSTIGSEMDGGFAQFVKTESVHALKIESGWSDVELASLPCAYSTAEGMLQRAQVRAETVLITGASGGVGSAAIQLAKRRNAKVIALCSEPKMGEVSAIGADLVLARDADLLEEIGTEEVDVVVDLVGGPNWPPLLDVLRRGGRYVTSGAIAGPIVDLDLRSLYLKDLSLLGSTYQPDSVFEDLVRYVEKNEIRALVAKTYSLTDIVKAQQDFMTKEHVGKLVLVPPAL